MWVEDLTKKRYQVTFPADENEEAVLTVGSRRRVSGGPAALGKEGVGVGCMCHWTLKERRGWIVPGGFDDWPLRHSRHPPLLRVRNWSATVSEPSLGRLRWSRSTSWWFTRFAASLAFVAATACGCCFFLLWNRNGRNLVAVQSPSPFTLTTTLPTPFPSRAIGVGQSEEELEESKKRSFGVRNRLLVYQVIQQILLSAQLSFDNIVRRNPAAVHG